MAKIDFPTHLENLLKESELQAPLRMLADRIGEILSGSELPFFPDYTDHGIDHINQVLKSEVELVPPEVWEKSKSDSSPRLLCDADAAVIIGATLFHDIAMYLHPDGFRELISTPARFEPVAWFKQNQTGHCADRSWHDLWQDYIREARSFSDRALINIVGEKSVREGWKFHDLPNNAGKWEANHCLVIGEFIRRHHTRLAHEIAIYGFPGLKVGFGKGEFPALGKEEGYSLKELADLIGLAARSHGTSLRVCKAYLDSHYPGTPRPVNVAVLYPMALLRVADYLQIDKRRAPAVLLQLRNPQSLISVQEWKKTLAVENISPANDPRGKMITVSRNIGLELYLQLRDLLTGIQAEMDHSTAVLDEFYGTLTKLGLHQLELATRRVHSNLDKPAFRDGLPFVPERTGFSVDPNLLTLLVEPLYGKEPSVGVRELMQNSVDAVRELKVWCEVHKKPIKTLDLPKQAADVLIEFVERDDETWFVRVTDKGIGMRSDTIQNFFLRAGATFRQSPDWAKDFLDKRGEPRVLRAGRFGIGAFAIFLLGNNFRMKTRHVTAENAIGYAVDGTADSHIIEIRKKDNLPTGTTIEVELSTENAANLIIGLDKKYRAKKSLLETTDWFTWDWPVVRRQVVRKTGTIDLPQNFTVRTSAPEWAKIRPKGFDAIYWSFAEGPSLSCNGLIIGKPDDETSHEKNFEFEDFDWPEARHYRRPNIAVLDDAANLPLTIQRYTLSNKELPFASELAHDVALSVIAHALVCGPVTHALLPNSPGQIQHPLSLLHWCSTRREFVVSDPWLYSFLKNNEHCFVYGALLPDKRKHYGTSCKTILTKPEFAPVFLCWNKQLNDESDPLNIFRVFSRRKIDLTGDASVFGVNFLRHKPLSARAILSVKGRQTIRYSSNYPDVKIQRIAGATTGRYWYEFAFGNTTAMLPLENVLREIEENMGRDSHSKFLYVADIAAKSTHPKPESLIAKIWNECLGARAIPFEPKARRKLIEHGRHYPELKRHIEAWEEMKRTSSKWVTGKVSEQ